MAEERVANGWGGARRKLVAGLFESSPTANRMGKGQ